eukprot:tig00021036_g17404.t1
MGRSCETKMIICFLIDSSASMNQRAANGMSLLDCAKSAVEHFLKVRSRDPNCRGDRYLLVTCEDGPCAVKIGWKDPPSRFTQELKNIRARDLTGLGSALKRALDLLNQFRLQSSIDNYGQGRNPWFIEPSIVLVLTDGSEFTSRRGIEEELVLPTPHSLGTELTVEPFRWDQRVFAAALRFPAFNNANPLAERERSADAVPMPLYAMCQETGGRFIVAPSMKHLLQWIEADPVRAPPGVCLNFELLASPTASEGTWWAGQHPHRLIIVRAAHGTWPLPESFWPDLAARELPPRRAHPTVVLRIGEGTLSSLADTFPSDRYELESSPLSGHLAQASARAPILAYVRGSSRDPTPGALGDPVGYIRPTPGGQGALLVLLPYNFPRLFVLLDEWTASKSSGGPPGRWRSEFEKYLASVPPYYLVPLRTTLKRWGLSPAVFPDTLQGQEVSLSNAVAGYLRRLKQQAKAEAEAAAVAQQQTVQQPPSAPPGPTGAPSPAPVRPATTPPPAPATVRPPPTSRSPEELQRAEALAILAHWSSPGDDAPPPSSLPEEWKENAQTEAAKAAPEPFRGGEELGLQGLPLRALHLRRLVPGPPAAPAVPVNGRMLSPAGGVEEAAERHSVSVAAMGNYHEKLAKTEVPRDPFSEDPEDRGRLRPNFGNPFRSPARAAARAAAAPQSAPAAPGGDEEDEANQGPTNRGRRPGRPRSPAPPRPGSRPGSPAPSPGAPCLPAPPAPAPEPAVPPPLLRRCRLCFPAPFRLGPFAPAGPETLANGTGTPPPAAAAPPPPRARPSQPSPRNPSPSPAAAAAPGPSEPSRTSPLPFSAARRPPSTAFAPKRSPGPPYEPSSPHPAAMSARPQRIVPVPLPTKLSAIGLLRRPRTDFEALADLVRSVPDAEGQRQLWRELAEQARAYKKQRSLVDQMEGLASAS